MYPYGPGVGVGDGGATVAVGLGCAAFFGRCDAALAAMYRAAPATRTITRAPMTANFALAGCLPRRDPLFRPGPPVRGALVPGALVRGALVRGALVPGAAGSRPVPRSRSRVRASGALVPSAPASSASSAAPGRRPGAP